MADFVAELWPIGNAREKALTVANKAAGHALAAAVPFPLSGPVPTPSRYWPRRGVRSDAAEPQVRDGLADSLRTLVL